jgi:hypothetical protein
MYIDIVTIATSGESPFAKGELNGDWQEFFI